MNTMLPLYRKYGGILLITFFSLIPVLLWLPYSSFSDLKSVFLSFGQVFALVGTVLFSINFILSARFRFLEPLFEGLNRIYIVHHFLGAVSFILLLYHPVFVALYYVPISVLAAAKILFSNLSNLPVFFGMVALLIMIVVLIITFFIHLPYQNWKVIHKFLGLSLFLASLHIFLIPSTVTVSIPLRIYILGFAFLGLISYSYRVLLHKFLVRKYKYTVSSTKLVNPDTVEVVLTPVSKTLRYLPGQFVFVDFESLGIAKEVHPFSLTSSPESAYLSLAIKSSGDYTETIKLLKKDSAASVEGPFGFFTYSRYENKRQIWIAGGIGITPFLGMARSLGPQNSYQIDLIYQTGVPEEMVFQDELTELPAKTPGFRFFPFFSKTQGRISADVVSKMITDFSSADIFLCGPPPMMASLRSQFRKLGIKNSHIHSEEFSLE